MSHSRTTSHVIFQAFAKVEGVGKAAKPTGRRHMKSFTITELSGVDSPAQKPAKICLMKRETPEEREAFEKGSKIMLTETEGHTHLISLVDYDGKACDGGYTSYERATGEEYGHSHPWVMNDDGTISVGPATGHNHKVPKASKRDDALDNDGASAPKITIKSEGGTPGTHQETTMDKDQEIATLKTTVAKRDSLLKGILALTAAQFAAYQGMSETEGEAFLAKSSSERDEVVEAIAKRDPVVYTAKDGTVYRKSDGEKMISLAKRADDDAAKIAKAEEEAATATFAKRAATELGNLPHPEVHGSILRAVEKGVAVPEADLPKVAEVFKAANARIAKAMTTIGTNGADADPADETPTGDYQKGLRKFAKAESIDDLAAAEVKFLKTAEGRAAYAAMENAKLPSAQVAD